MKELARLKYTLKHLKNDPVYLVDKLDIDILDDRLINGGAKIPYCFYKDFKFSFTRENENFRFKWIGVDPIDETKIIIIKDNIISNVLFDNGSIINFTDSIIPIIYNKNSKSNNILINDDNTFSFIYNNIGLTYDADSILEYHKNSNTIFEYRPRRNRFSNNIYIYDNIMSKNMIFDDGIITEYYDDDGLPRKDLIYKDKNLIKTKNRIDTIYNFVDRNIYYLNNVYNSYEIDGTLHSVFPQSNFINLDAMDTIENNYAFIVDDFDVIIDPLFPQESNKGNKIHVNSIKVFGDNLFDAKRRECSVEIEMILYNDKENL
jgi:hypothetical protein